VRGQQESRINPHIYVLKREFKGIIVTFKSGIDRANICVKYIISFVFKE
jgi:hypothetical protein